MRLRLRDVREFLTVVGIILLGFAVVATAVMITVCLLHGALLNYRQNNLWMACLQLAIALFVVGFATGGRK